GRGGAGGLAAGQGCPGPRVPVRGEHRAAAAAWAPRAEAPPVVRAGHDQPPGRGVPEPGRRGGAGPGGRRHGPGDLPARHDRAGGAGVAPGGAGQLLHPAPPPPGGGPPAHERPARPVRQEPRVQVLRGPDRAGPPRGPVMARARERAPGVEARAGRFPGPSLIPALNAIQERVGWLPREELVSLSRDVRRPLYEIEGLVSFYPHFRTEPPKKTEIRVCHDLSCWLRGADARIEAIRDKHGANADAGIVEGSCLGRCDIAPAGSVNEQPLSLDAILEHRPGQAAVTLPPAADSPASPARWPNDPYPAAAGRYAVLRDVLAGRLGTERLIAEITDAGLRGMGGAGFPAGRKWSLVAAQEAAPKYVICNADESEPGTFKDREILATQ